MGPVTAEILLTLRLCGGGGGSGGGVKSFSCYNPTQVRIGKVELRMQWGLDDYLQQLCQYW